MSEFNPVRCGTIGAGVDSSPFGVAVNPAGTLAYVTNSGGAVSVIAL